MYINNIIHFPKGTGCIPPDSLCYCYNRVGEYLYVNFRHSILGRNDLRLHIDLVTQHGVIIKQ